MGRVNGQVQHEVKLQQKFKELVFRDVLAYKLVAARKGMESDACVFYSDLDYAVAPFFKKLIGLADS